MNAPNGRSVEASAAEALTPRGRFFANQTFHFETLRNAGAHLRPCADLGEVLETVRLISEGDMQGWYAAWAAAADRALALAERTRDPQSKGGAYMRASTYQRTGDLPPPPDDPKRPESFAKKRSATSLRDWMRSEVFATRTLPRRMRTDGCARSTCRVRRDRRRDR